MPIDAPKAANSEALALAPVMLEADDKKIRRILAVLDGVADPAVNKVLLDPLRERLAVLKPARPLRFARLLFIPMDPLAVPIGAWRPGEPLIPRSILTQLAKITRAGLEELARSVDKIIADGKSDPTQAITDAGEALWPRAAEILATAPMPADWAATGCEPASFKPLVAALAAVFRRAPQLRRLALSEDIGALDVDEQAMEGILLNIADESELGCAMIARLILVQSPRAAGLLRRIVAMGRTPIEKAVIQTAMDRGISAVLDDMERTTGFADIGHAAAAEVGPAVRRMTTLLREIENDTGSVRHWPRLKPIRARLDQVCRDRITREVGDNLIHPLATASAPIGGQAQTDLESRSRDVRVMEAAARKIAAAPGYDLLLRSATNAVEAAAGAGILTPMRGFRLLEILAGSEAAEALYLKARANKAAG
jgi:hypothetical protein